MTPSFFWLNSLFFSKKHAFIKKKQADYFYTLHHFPGENQAVVQVDFSENASTVCQDEVQSAHWSHAQVALYTVVAWTPEGTYSYAIISDYLSHDKYAVQHFNSIIITNINDRMKGWSCSALQPALHILYGNNFPPERHSSQLAFLCHFTR